MLLKTAVVTMKTTTLNIVNVPLEELTTHKIREMKKTGTKTSKQVGINISEIKFL